MTGSKFNVMRYHLDRVADLLEHIPGELLDRISQALWETYQRDGTIFVCGNGGSAATASHFACDLTKSTVYNLRRRVRALALTDSVPLLTALTNDEGYGLVFKQQLVALYRPGDLLFTLSYSGASWNVIKAAEWAVKVGCPCVVLQGGLRGSLATLTPLKVVVGTDDPAAAEDVHSALCHALAKDLKRRLQEGSV